MLRTMIERLSRGKSLKRRLPPRFGQVCLYVSPDAQLKYLKPGEAAFDPDLLKVVDEYICEDSVVWDIGANVGVFSFAAASIARRGSTLAVEADIWLAQLMRQSLSLNRDLNLQVVPCAVSDSNGVASFLIANRGRASNALEVAGGRSQAGGVRERAEVATLTLDTLLEFSSSPTFIKVDVEGAETLVLKGAAKVLADIRPTFYIEVGKEANSEVTRIFETNRYALFDGARPFNQQQPSDRCTHNTIAVPREQL